MMNFKDETPSPKVLVCLLFLSSEIGRKKKHDIVFVPKAQYCHGLCILVSFLHDDGNAINQITHLISLVIYLYVTYFLTHIPSVCMQVQVYAFTFTNQRFRDKSWSLKGLIHAVTPQTKRSLAWPKGCWWSAYWSTVNIDRDASVLLLPSAVATRSQGDQHE